MDAEDGLSTPDEMLAEIGRVRKHTRQVLAQGTWRYLAVWAVVFLGAWLASFFTIAPFYWIIGVPGGYLGMWLAFRNVAPAADRKETPYWLTGGAMFLVNSIAGFLLPGETVVVVVWVVLGVGFAVLSWLDRQPAAAGLFAGLAAVSAALGVTVEDRFELYSMLALIFTLVTASLALALWLWGRDP